MRRLVVLPALLLSLTAPAGAGSFDRKIGELDEQLIFAAPRDAIPALTNPDLLTATAASLGGSDVENAYLDDTDRVLGVVHNGVARAYPLNLGWWHEVINDRIGDGFISVTYCPLTGTGLVFDANTDSGQLELGVSGLLLNSNLVLYDRRDDRSLYPQMTYVALIGDYRDESLQLLPVVETTWALWKRMHPDTMVPRIGSGLGRYSDRIRTNYGGIERFLESSGGYPYDTYRTDDQVYFPVTTASPDLSVYRAKDVVLGICLDGSARAYPLRDLPDAAVVNDRVGSVDVVLLFDEDTQTAIPYERRVAGRLLSFYAAPADDGLPLAFADRETGSRWNLLGLAIAGPLQGQQLAQVPAYNSMWFAWNAFWPDSEIWDGTGIITDVVTLVDDGGDDAAADVAGSSLVLGANAPNPFNAATRVGFDLRQSATLELTVHNAVGQSVRILAAGWRSAGHHELIWDGRDDGGRNQASGTYFLQLRLTDTGEIRRQRLTLIR